MGTRSQARAATERDIVDIGRRHLASVGAANLSLRAIARELGMVSSAIYRYVASRDELLTLLLVDAYTDLADAVDTARARPAGDWRDRVRAMAHAARGWAVADPARWALLYGSPVPGYHAPAERTVGPGTRVVGAVLAVVAEGAGSVADVEGTVSQRLSHRLSRDYVGIRDEFGIGGDDATMTACLALWAGLVGAIGLEVFGQYGADTFADPVEVFDAQVTTLLSLFVDRN